MPKELSQEYLKSILDYNHETGVFTWIKRRATWIPSGTIAGSYCENGYRIIVINSQIYRAHRLAWLYMTGENPPEFIDHINLNRSDNRFCNIRLATRSENMQNFKIRPDNKSGVKGVYWDNKSKKWRASIQCNKKRFNLGMFNNIADAEKCITEARVKMHKEFSNHG